MPPKGLASWDGGSLAAALGVPDDANLVPGTVQCSWLAAAVLSLRAGYALPSAQGLESPPPALRRGPSLCLLTRAVQVPWAGRE